MSPTIGKCHICKEPERRITFCPLCDHWFCPKCKREWFWRGLEAVKQKINGKSPGCCGPQENSNAA